MTSRFKTNEQRPDISVGREDAEAPPRQRPDDDGEGHGHPLPSSEKARHGTIPESVERTRGHGSN